MTHKRLFAFLIALFPLLTISCTDDDDDDLVGNWVRVSDFDGVARSEASSFCIGNKGYLVCGYDAKKAISDFWEYDMTLDTWTQKAGFPGPARYAAVAFTAGDKGYFGTGYDNENKYNDFWEYNPATDTWRQVADFPGSARYSAVAFGVDNKGYVGAGYDGNYLKDFYAFNPASNSWTQIISIGGTKRMGATSFVIDGTAYVCGGANNGTYVDDFWKYEPSTGLWTQMRDIANNSDDDYDDDYAIVRTNGSAFVIDGAAYLSGGESGSVRSDTWKYYPATDLWEQVHDFKGSARTVAVAFSNGTQGFIATGKSGTYRFDDIWELHPYDYDPDDE